MYATRRAGRIGHAEDLIDNIMVFSIEDCRKRIASNVGRNVGNDRAVEHRGRTGIHQALSRRRPRSSPTLIVFDNVQDLLVRGVQKEEETWTPVLPLVQWLSKQLIAQIWIDHTGPQLRTASMAPPPSHGGSTRC